MPERVDDSGEAVSDGPGGGLDPRFDAEFGEDVGDVRGGGALGDEQRRGDLAVGAPGRHQPQHLQLPRREAERCPRAPGALTLAG